jgi:transcriptional regulator with XRE-family HTH domain/energy-coupling factor transporter ATP-binding protein EcfA2
VTPNARSAFATGLQRLLDETGRFTRAEWARYLGVSTSALSQWVNDKTVPRADLLRIILDVLRRSAGVPSEPMAAFEDLMEQPAEEITPLGTRMAPSVAEYLKRSTHATLAQDLRMLPPDKQQEVLLQGGWDDRSTEGAVPESPSVRALDEGAYTDSGLLPFLREESARPTAAQVPWQSLLADNAALLVGSAGSGKTALLQALARALQESEATNVLLIAARDHWGTDSRQPRCHPWEDAAPALDALLVDGVDEIPAEDRLRVADDLRALAENRPKAVKVYVSSRPVPELALFDAMKKYWVAPLTSVQMVLWLRQGPKGLRKRSRVGELDLERFLCHLVERRHMSRSLRNPLLLSRAWSLFARNAVTPFAETEILGELSRSLLDPEVVRARAPWASPRNLHRLLGEICLQLVRAGRHDFSTADAAMWLAGHLRDIPCDRLLQLLAVQSGVLSEQGPERWTFADPYFGRYFAATRLVESADDPWPLLGQWRTREDIRDVLRLVCGITSDATALLEGILEASDVTEPDRCSLLADALAQPLAASPAALAASCSATVSWLDKSFSSWRVEPLARASPIATRDSLWGLCAIDPTRAKLHSKVTPTLATIHRARSGPARDLLVERLAQASSPFLSNFATAMECEGKLHWHYELGGHQPCLDVAVLPPELN